MMGERILLRSGLQTQGAPQDSCTFSLYPKALGVGDRHKEGAEILTSVWNSVSRVQNQTGVTGAGFNMIWKGQRATHFCSRNRHEKTHPTRQSQGSSYQSLVSLSWKTLQILLTNQSLLPPAFCAEFTEHTSTRPLLPTLQLFISDSRNFCFQLQTPKLNLFIRITV